MPARPLVRFSCALCLAVILVAVSGPAQAQSVEDAKPIGKIVSVKGSATVEHTQAVILQARLAVGSGKTKIGDLVFRGDVVQTGPDSGLGITFADGTAFSLSSNARMELNEFVYDPNGKSNSTLFSLAKGTFTFFAGQVAKTGEMKVETPVATMGIRGTTPHVEIRSDGTVSFSTLVEEDKSKRGSKQRRAGTASSPVQQAQAESNQQAKTQLRPNKVDINYKPCKGC